MRYIWISVLLLGLFTRISYSVDRSLDVWKDLFSQDVLIVANYPERVTYPGSVFKERLEKKPLRVMYYYHNVTTSTFFINLIIRNHENSLQQVRVLKSVAGPNKDGLFTGHMFSKSFLSKLNTSDFETLTITPNGTVQLVYHGLPPKRVSGGVVWIKSLQNGHLDVELDIVESEYSQFSRSIPSSTERSSYKYGRFDSSYKRIMLTYNPQELMTGIDIGGPPFSKDDDNNILLKGNYGVLYDISIKLINPSPLYHQVDLLLSRLGGISRLSFLLDGEVRQTRYFNVTKGQDPERLQTFILKPRETRKVHMLLMPQAGSFYPVRLVLKTIPIVLKE